MDSFCPRKSQSHSGNLFASLPLPLLIFKSSALLVRSFHCFFKVIPAFTIWVIFFLLSSFSLCCVSYPYVGSAPIAIVSGAVQCPWIDMYRAAAALDAVVRSCGQEFCGQEFCTWTFSNFPNTGFILFCCFSINLGFVPFFFLCSLFYFPALFGSLVKLPHL